MTLHFKSMAAFRRFNAYRFIHGIKTKHKQKVVVAGRTHHVKHASVHHKRTINKMLSKYM